MTIYEIDDAITSLVDMETGEIEDEQRFDELQMERGKKIENIGLYYKNLVAEAKAIRDEEASLAERRKAIENKAERMKNLLAYALNGERFETARIRCSYRKSSSIEVDDGFVEWAERNADGLLTYSLPKPNKIAIKKALAMGDDLQHVQLVTTMNVQVR